MQLRRSTKLLLPLLGICGALWIFSNFCVASLAIPMGAQRQVLLIVGDSRIYFWWAPWRSPTIFEIELLDLPNPPGDTIFGDGDYSEGPQGEPSVLIAIRWWVICTLVALIWLAFWVRHRRRTRMQTNMSAERTLR